MLVESDIRLGAHNLEMLFRFVFRYSFRRWLW
jgi:hypothetical protein